MSVELKEVKNRMASIRQVHKVTTALQVIAASELQQNRRALERANVYMDSLRSTFSRVGPEADAFEHPLMKVPKGGRILLLAFGAERGLCGGFNTELLHRAHAFADAHAGVELAVFGRVLVRWTRRAGLSLVLARGQPRKAERTEVIGRLARWVVGQFMSGRYGEVHALYHRFESALRQRVVIEPLLPLRGFPAAREGGAPRDRRPVTLEPSAETILTWLVSEWLALSINLAFLNSLGSESGARQQATLRASENAAEMLDDLGMRFRRMRQESITSEMLELSAGGAA